jgi:hypothetical protein
MSQSDAEFLTAGDVSRIPGVDLTPAGVVLAADSGRLPIAARTPGGLRLFRRTDAETFASNREAARRTAAKVAA